MQGESEHSTLENLKSVTTGHLFIYIQNVYRRLSQNQEKPENLLFHNCTRHDEILANTVSRERLTQYLLRAY